ncbi:hypothetical protein GP486_000913 [Trichoglossum hirsutum]|uniref:ATPase synthesis protein 25 n=1 Tax=Trichoglossum hirsutum TaxID=265104 RepID=A0A9P8LHU7_9PEZI|nr:hypothetical protein GP486_000913 [Trichoglossum hirsutum]
MRLSRLRSEKFRERKSAGGICDGAMVLMRGFVNASRCSPCRLAILRSFVSTVDTPSRPGLLFGVHSGVRLRSLSKSCMPQVPLAGNDAQDIRGDGQSTKADENDNSRSTSSIDTVPWYLQVETTRRAPQSISDRQQIPDPPVGSPPLLKPLLEHISVDLGLDDLKIIDLRNLDPPPALGSDLIMIIGTARSEKHLHVSADRLCRWLRSDHNLSPFADGLLGRNELKLKLKRKARRSKLLRSVGSSERDGIDDGIRTGWVCVNAGRVEGSYETHETTTVDGFVGFGTGSRGVRLVVQMLTEEKREELDLESLWGDLLDRKARRDAKTRELAERAIVSRATGNHVDMATWEKSKVPSTQTAYSQSPAAGHHALQTRRIHTSARRLTEALSNRPSAILENDVFMTTRLNGSPVPRNSLSESLMRSLASAIDVGDYHSVHRMLCNIEPLILRHSFDDGGKELLLRAHLNHLRNLPHGKALELLGDSPSAHLSSAFLFSFYQSLPTFLDQQHWQCQVELLCYGIELGHRRCTKSGLMTLFSHMCISGVDIPMATFVMILRVILNDNGVLVGPEKWSSDIQVALQVLEEMGRRGHNILTEDIFVLLLEKINCPSANDAGPDAMTAKRRLLDIIFAYDIPLTKEESLLRILPLYANQGDWTNFWLLWKGIAMRALRRTEALYALMFRSVAKTSNQAQCMHALRMGVPDMEIEEPPVLLTGDVALAAKECLVAAVPWVSEDAQKEPLVDGEWTRLWRRCEHGLSQSTH